MAKLEKIKMIDDVGEFFQAKYGVVIDPMQPAYGVVIEPMQPAYGVPYRSDINITYNQLEEMISSLKKAINTMKDTWNSGTRANIIKLESSWVGKDCEAYTAKLNKMNGNVQRTIQALELLCSTYEKARDMVKDSQNKTYSAINGG